MSNWNYIKGYCRDQTHRDDISDEAMLNFQRVALSRINRDGGLRGQALRSVETVSFTPFFLPDECQEVLEISVANANGSGRIKLKAVDRALFQDWQNIDSAQAEVYLITGNTIQFAPAATGFDATFFYRAGFPFLENDNEQNTLTREYPSLLIYAMLIEIYMNLRDSEGVAMAQQMYAEDMRKFNARDHYKEAGDMPQASGATKWL